jgi:hypothetical protein
MGSNAGTDVASGTSTTTTDPTTDQFIMDQIAAMFFQKFALEKITDFQAEMNEDDE